MKTRSVRCKVTIEYVLELEDAVAVAFGANCATLGRSALDRQNAGDAAFYDVPQDAAHLIPEEIGDSIRGERETVRTLRDLPARDDASFTLRAPGESGCVHPLPLTARSRRVRDRK